MAKQWLILKICLLVTVFLAFLFMTIGYAVPWIVGSYNSGLSQRKDHTFKRALWYNKLCPDDENTCTSSTHGDLQAEIMAAKNPEFQSFANIALETMVMKDKEEWETWQVCSTVSLILTFLGTFIAVFLVWYTANHHYKKLNICVILGFFLFLVASCLMWVPVGMVAEMTVYLENSAEIWEKYFRLLEYPLKVDVEKSAGLILAAIGAFFAVVAAILFLLFIYHPKPFKEHTQRPRHDPVPYNVETDNVIIRHHPQSASTQEICYREPVYSTYGIAPQYIASPKQNYIMNRSTKSHFTGDDYFTRSHNSSWML